MKLRTWTQLSTDELKRRRGMLRVILTIQAAGLIAGGVTSTAAWFASPTAIGLLSVFSPLVLVGVCWLVYRWSERHWYLAVYLYLFSTLVLNCVGMYTSGGAQGPMVGFFAFIVFAAAMLVDLRAGVEWTLLSLVVYGIYAFGVPLGWIKLPMDTFESTKLYTFPTFFTLSLVVLSLLILLFGNSLNRSLEQSRRSASDLEKATLELTDKNRQAEEVNRQLQALAAIQQRHATQLQAAADVSTAITQVTEVEELLPRIVQVIRQQFDLYYVGLFLLDEASRSAVLRAGTGEAGRVMKERNHRLEVGGQSMVGWACANKRARIALDVGAEAVRFAPGTAQGFANPLLPETRSEMALPIMTGERVLGVLDVQSTQAAAFDESDVAVLQSMADQIAVAMGNARLLQQTQAALQQLEVTNRLLVRQGWQGYLERPSAVRHSELAIAQAPGDDADGNAAESLAIPLELRGQRLGQLELRREGNRPWTEEEKEMIQAVALQTILAADNARLVEQTQFALQETEGLFAAARDIAQAAQVQDICQSLASYVNVLEQADRTIVTLADTNRRQILARVGAGNLEDELDMTFDEFDAGLGGKVIRSGESILSPSADDSHESKETRERRKRHDIGALIIVPMSIKGQIIGTVSIVNRTHQRKFHQHNVDLATALAGPAATALENVRLLEATQRRAERERLIRQITTRVRAAGDIQGILETTAAELAQAIGASRAIVRLTASDGR